VFPPGKIRFRAEANQLLSVVVMVAAVFVIAAGAVAPGVVMMVVAAALSIGGLFWNAHRQDQVNALERKNAKDAAAPAAGKD